VEDGVGPRRYLELQSMNDEAMAWGKRFYMKGAFLADLTDASVAAALSTVEDVPSPGASITLWAHGGAIARVPEDAMAFTGRGAACWLGVESEWDHPADDDEHVAWARQAMAALEPFTAAGHYVNDMVETGEDVARRVYGAAKYDRLVDLKRRYDPDNVFRLNQNVRP
jgi:FAD/FMN-containing dehydrogenase